jgi:hypothetical protein
MARLIAGKRNHKRYKGIELENTINKTIEAVTISYIEQEDGKAQLYRLLFTDGTQHGFVAKTDE